MFTELDTEWERTLPGEQPLIPAVMDVTGLLIYFAIATFFLP